MMNDNIEISGNSGTCQSCGSKFKGKFCSICGEKKFNPKHDLSITKFLEHSIDMFIHLDSKFFKTFIKLFFYPGMLTKYYISGRRVLYMKPMQLFVLASIIFYFLLPSANAYFSAIEDLNGKFGIQNIIHYNVNDKILEKSMKHNASKERVVNSVYVQAIHSSKLFLFSILPFWALILFALFYKSNKFYVSHVVFSIHCFSFFILIHMLYLSALSWFMNSEPLFYLIPLFIIFALYVIFAIRKVYQSGIIVTIMKGIVVCLSFLILLELYRECITIMTLMYL